MSRINRNTFLKRSLFAGGSLLLAPLSNNLLFAESHVLAGHYSSSDLMTLLVKGNDAHVSDLLLRGDAANRHGGRSLGYNFAKFSAAYCHPSSSYYANEALLVKLGEITDKLLSLLRPDGTVNAGNLESPPDTAFIMEPLCSGVYILSQNDQKDLDKIKEAIKGFIQKVGNALTTGGVHTPNHRWEICSALAWINKLYPDAKYVNRIDEWLSEGIFIDEDGHYPERSMNYADVENRAFITIGRLLNRPKLYNPVMKALEMTYYYMEPNGDLVTFDSRRQDQYSTRNIIVQYLHYRYLAIELRHAEFSAIASLIEKQPEFESDIINEALYCFMANPVLGGQLPAPQYPSTDYERLFKTSSLARIRRNETTVTLFGGNDWPLIIASGRSVSPNFFAYRKGKAILKYMRMSSRFFSMGYFRSEGLSHKNGKYLLYKKLEAPYYQPLPKKHRNKDGDYELTPSIDDRFWSKMSFDKRPVSNVKTLESQVTVTKDQGKVTLDFEVSGQEGVAVTIHLCFSENGVLKGVEKAPGNEKDYFLKEGFGEFICEGDKITFGPGIKRHDTIRGLEGEKYSVHFGSLNTPGQHVYLTGYTPFKYSLMFS